MHLIIAWVTSTIRITCVASSNIGKRVVWVQTPSVLFHEATPALLFSFFMEGHVSPENLSGGWKNQTSASIVPDRHPSCLSLWVVACCGTPLLVMMVRVALIRLLSLFSMVLCSSCDWDCMVTYTPIPSLHHVFPSPITGSAVCRNAFFHPQWERVVSVNSPMVRMQVCLCEFMVQLSVCTAAGLGVTALVSGVPLCKDVKVCHWASLWECSRMLSYSSSRLPAEVYNA